MEIGEIYHKESDKILYNIDDCYFKFDLFNRFIKYKVESLLGFFTEFNNSEIQDLIKILSNENKLKVEKLLSSLDEESEKILNEIIFLIFIEQLNIINNVIDSVLFILKLNGKKISDCNDNCLKHRQIGEISVEILVDHTQKAIRKANTDQLTGLKNSSALKDDCEKLIKEEVFFNIVLIDLDNFKQINDIFGHLAGDRILIEFSKIFKEIFEDDSTFVYRLGGDEFVSVSKKPKNELIEKLIFLNEVLRTGLISFINSDELKQCVINLGVSYGISYSNEKGINKRTSKKDYSNLFKNNEFISKNKEEIIIEEKLRGLIELADYRMYGYKSKNKKNK